MAVQDAQRSFANAFLFSVQAREDSTRPLTP